MTRRSFFARLAGLLGCAAVVPKVKSADLDSGNLIGCPTLGQLIDHYKCHHYLWKIRNGLGEPAEYWTISKEWVTPKGATYTVRPNGSGGLEIPEADLEPVTYHFHFANGTMTRYEVRGRDADR